MSQRTIYLGAAGTAIVAGLATIFCFSGSGCRDLHTHVGQRTLYTGPTTFPAPVEDWPAWRGPRGDGISHETSIARAFPAAGPARLWTADVGLGYSSPVAVGGRIFLFTLNDQKETLTAFDANTGRLIWSEEDLAGGGWASGYPGTRATPAVDSGRIYTLGGAGEVVCRDTVTGKQQWRLNVLKLTGAGIIGYGCASSPLVAGDKVFVQGGDNGSIAVAINKTTGAVAWQSEAKGVAGYAHPILTNDLNQLIILGGRDAVGMDPDTGKTLWTYPWKTSYDVNSATPIYAGGHLFITSAYDHGCAMLKISANEATKEWESRKVMARFQPPILDRGLLFANSEGTIKCLSWPDGELKWKGSDSELKAGIGGSIVRVGDELLILSDRGKLILAHANGAGISVLAQAEVFDDHEVWATPLLYGGRLYAKGSRELVCLDLSGPK